MQEGNPAVGISFFAPDRKRSMSLQKPIPTLGFLGSPISALRAIPQNLRLTPYKHARTVKYAAFFGIAQALILNFLRRHLKTYFLRFYQVSGPPGKSFFCALTKLHFAALTAARKRGFPSGNRGSQRLLERGNSFFAPLISQEAHGFPFSKNTAAEG